MLWKFRIRWNLHETASCDKYTKPVLDLDIVKGYVLCTAEHCSLRSRKRKLYAGIKSRYPKITAAMEKLLFFE